MCSICGSIGPGATANTGRDEYFQAPITSLKRHDLDSQRDLRECPECGAFFYYEEYVAQTGSGNNDEDTLTRLSAQDTATARQILHETIVDPRSVARGLFAANHAVRDLLGSQACRLILPAILDELRDAPPGEDDWGVRRVASYMEGSPARLAEVKALLAKAPVTPTLDLLRALSRRVDCATCRAIEVYPETEANRDTLAGLHSLGVDASRDVLECPACESLFLWKTVSGPIGTIARVPDLVYFALRALVRRRGPVSRTAMGAVFGFGETWAQLVFRYALHHDREILREFIPEMEKVLARDPKHWLREFLYHAPDGA